MNQYSSIHEMRAEFESGLKFKIYFNKKLAKYLIKHGLSEAEFKIIYDHPHATANLNFDNTDFPIMAGAIWGTKSSLKNLSERLKVRIQDRDEYNVY